jgi:hypothetical protein
MVDESNHQSGSALDFSHSPPGDFIEAVELSDRS